MSNLADEINRQIDHHKLTQAQVAMRAGFSQGQISKWTRSDQVSIDAEQLAALAKALSNDVEDHAALVRAHLLDEKFGPGAELVEVALIHASVLSDKPKPRSKGERAMAWLAQERLRNPELNEMLIDLARLLGAKL